LGFLGLHSKESACNTGDLQEMWVRSLGQEDPLEEEMATHFSCCLQNPMERSLVGYTGSHRVEHN